MHKALPNHSQELPQVDAGIARKLLGDAIETSLNEEALLDEYRETLAVQLCGQVLREVEKAASCGKTHLDYFLRDRLIPRVHREIVIQRVASYLDERGFNVLLSWRYSLLGSGTTLQIEW